MMKAAIVTFWDTGDNYGSLLQNYALQTFLRSRGMKTCLVRAYGGKTGNLKSSIKYVYRTKGVGGIIKSAILFVPKRIFYKRIARKNSHRCFDEFRRTELNQTKLYEDMQDLRSNPVDADFYITGSDQVWNLFCPSEKDLENFIDLYFLNFGVKGVRRVACSVCICKNEIRSGCEKKLSELIKSFELVTTRERFGVEWCGRLGCKNAFYQPDPSFLLSADDYRMLYGNDKSFLPKGKFVLMYLLNNKCDFSVSRLKKWAKNRGLSVVYVSGNEIYLKLSLRKKLYATIPQWLELFDRAEFVFTNSFHGTVFSIIYNKKFLTIEQRGRWEYSNSRVHDLLDSFGLDKRIFTGELNQVNSEIVYADINKHLFEIRTSSKFVSWANEVMMM